MRPLFLIIGKSGCGKNWICDALEFNSIPSYTTREMRKGEIDGKEHIFITKDEYEKKYKHSIKAAYTYFNNNHYFATIDQAEDPKYNAYIVDVDGLDYILDLKKDKWIKRDLNIIYIKSRWYKRLYRMIKRDGITKAIKRFIHDIRAFSHFDEVVKFHTIKYIKN